MLCHPDFYCSYPVLVKRAWKCTTNRTTWSQGLYSADPKEVYDRPKIYIYDLPYNWTHCAPHVDEDFWAIYGYGSEIEVGRYFNRSAHRTSDPEDADLFFVPALFYCAAVHEGPGGLGEHDKCWTLLCTISRIDTSGSPFAKPIIGLAFVQESECLSSIQTWMHDNSSQNYDRGILASSKHWRAIDNTQAHSSVNHMCCAITRTNKV